MGVPGIATGFRALKARWEQGGWIGRLRELFQRGERGINPAASGVFLRGLSRSLAAQPVMPASRPRILAG